MAWTRWKESLILAAALLYLNCGYQDQIGLPGNEEAGTLVVRIGDRSYYRGELERFFESRLQDFTSLGDADGVKSALLESFIEEKLFLQEAERQNVEPDPQAMKYLLDQLAAGSKPPGSVAGPDDEEELKRSLAEGLRIQQYLKEFVLRDLEVPEQECREYYDEHVSEYIRNDVVHLHEILVGDKSQAEKVLASLKENRNKNFAELARLYSKAPTAAEGGNLGRFERGDLPKDFEKEIFRLSPGTVSKIIPSEHGFHIFFVEEKILAHHQKFYEVRDRIRDQLLSERGRAIIQKDMEWLMSRMPVEIYREGLDFRYTGHRFSSGGGAAQ